MNKLIFVILVSIMIIVSCGKTTVTAENDDQTSADGPIDPYDDPPDYTGDPFQNFPDVIGLSIPGEVPGAGEEEILTGTHFTIQITAATSEETAQRLAETVSAEITGPVFIDHIGDYWKVRVGAFPARQDAVEYLQVLVNMGFTDAWVTTREP